MKRKIAAILFALVLSVSIFSGQVFADYYTSQTTLSYGMWSNDVTDLQNDLRYLGYMYNSPTGYYGSITRQAVIAFQRNHNLYADGIAGYYTARSIKASTVVKTGKQYLGVPYAWGGTTPAGFDCSGFTQYVFSRNGVYIPRSASAQYEAGTWVSRSQLMPGDLVFFTTYKPGPSHVGIYIGNNQFINAGSSGVYISDLSVSYFAQRYIGAKRVL